MFLGRPWKRGWCLELGVSRSARQECWCASGSRGDCDWWEEVKTLEAQWDSAQWTLVPCAEVEGVARGFTACVFLNTDQTMQVCAQELKAGGRSEPSVENRGL
jgi:hypothetical protein